MAIQLKQLDDSNRDAFLNLLREPWQQRCWTSATAAFAEWRFFDRPTDDGGVTWLAMEDDQCVAMLDSMLRPYLFDGERIMVRETADWYCLPRLRSSGLGLRLMFHLRQYSEPAFVLGGTETGVSTLNKMRDWVSLPTAASMVLPLRARGLAANWVRTRYWKHEGWVHVVPNFLPAKPARQVKAPLQSSIQCLQPGDRVVTPLPDNNGLVQMLEQCHWDWLLRMPRSLARPMGLKFYADHALVGFSLSQIEPTHSGLDARITYLHAIEPHLAWVVSETTQRLADQGVGFIRACVSTPEKITAMQQVGYIKAKAVACHWWKRSLPIPSRLDVGYLRIDDSCPVWNWRTQ